MALRKAGNSWFSSNDFNFKPNRGILRLRDDEIAWYGDAKICFFHKVEA